MENVITDFYTAFQNGNAEKMVSHYHDDATFHDPAFGNLKGEQVKNMWRMLLGNAKDMQLTFSQVTADAEKGTAHWEAHYTFSKTGRKVHNVIDAQFKFREGKIIEHIDSFNLKNWAKQAMGFKGALLGGTKFFQRKLNQQTQQLLSNFESKL